MPYCDDWLVQVPLSQLVRLKGSLEELEQIRSENSQLRRELDGVRRIQTETLEKLSDLCRSYGK